MIDRLGIVIVNWNNKDVILDCLQSVRNAGYISNVIVVDNASSDDSIGEIKQKYPGINIIQNSENLGYAGGNNRGIKYLLDREAKYIFILNPDTEIKKDTIEKLIEVFLQDKKTGIAGPKIFDKEGKIWSCGGKIDKKRFSGGLIGLGEKDHGQYDQIREINYIPGTAMMVKKEVFEKVGLFEEKYFIYYEDTELSLRAKKAGFKIVFVPKAVIHHQESTSFGKKSGAHNYYMARNHLLFVERNAPVAIKLQELIRLLKTIWEHAKKKKKYAILGIKDYFLRRFGRRNDF